MYRLINPSRISVLLRSLRVSHEELEMVYPKTLKETTIKMVGRDLHSL